MHGGRIRHCDRLLAGLNKDNGYSGDNGTLELRIRFYGAPNRMCLEVELRLMEKEWAFETVGVGL